MANPPFRSSDRPGLFLGFSLVEPPNIHRLQTCSLTLRQAVNECRRPLQGLCTSSSLAKIGCLYLSKAFLVEVNFSVDIWEEAAISFEGIFGVEYFSDNIFGGPVHTREGISGSSTLPSTMSCRTATTSRIRSGKCIRYVNV